MGRLEIDRLNRSLRKLKVTRLANGRYTISPLLLLPVSEAADLIGESDEAMRGILDRQQLLRYWPKGRDAEPHVNLFAVLEWNWGSTRAVPDDWMDPEPEPEPVVRRLPQARTRPPISRQLRFKVLERDGFACRYCGRRGDDARLQVDHVMPKSAGGTDDEENLVTACFDCNHGKRAALGVQPPALEDAG